MATETGTIELDQATAAKLQAIADALQLSLDEYLSRIAELVALPQTNGQEKTEGLAPFDLVEDLIGSVDSSLPDDPTAPPFIAPQEENATHAVPDFGVYLLEKHNKEQRRFFALQKVATQQGVTVAEWVRQHFPNGRDTLGRSLAEFLDTLPSDTASTSPTSPTSQ